MTPQTEALKLALEALIGARAFLESDAPVEIWGVNDKAITAIKKALAQPEHDPYDEVFIAYGLPKPKQEPVALMIYRGELCYKSQEDDQSFGMWCPVTQDLPFPEGAKFYITPPQQRKPLTDEDLRKLADKHLFYQPEGYEVSGVFVLARAIEAAHGIKE